MTAQHRFIQRYVSVYGWREWESAALMFAISDALAKIDGRPSWDELHETGFEYEALERPDR